MKLRNQLLALFCLIVFIGIGVLFFRNWVVRKPFGIILFVSDSLVTSNLAAARLYDDHSLKIDSLPNLALAANHANDYAVPDSASASTAIATGVKVNNGAIAVDQQGNALKSILERAHEQGRVAGLITNGNITDAGVAAFYAHVGNSDQIEMIGSQFAGANLDLALGGGSAQLSPESEGGLRKDGRDLLLEMRDKGCQIVRTKAEMENASAFDGSLIGLFSEGNMAFDDQIESGVRQPKLYEMVRRAIQILQYHQRGYCLVVDDELTARAAEQNQGERVLHETLDFDQALATAADYAGPNVLIVAVGRHATGGMIMNGYPLRGDHGVTLLGINAFTGCPSITWANGPHGPLPAASSPPSLGGSASGDAAPAPAQPVAQTVGARSDANADEPAAFYASPAINCVDDVLAAGTGPGAQKLKGFIDNTFIFKLIDDNL